MKAPTIETQTAKIRMECGIIKVEIKENAKVELADALEHVAAAQKLSGQERFALLADISRVRTRSGAPKNVYGGEQAGEVLVALALLVDPATSNIGNFYIGVKQPFPTRIFTDEAAAMSWLLVV